VAPDPITRLIGQRVLERRKAAGMSQTALGERMTEQGSPWSRTSVAKLEAGKRGAVTVQELLALALVFDVPPVLLIADPREQEKLGDVPIAKDLVGDQWGVLLWLVGVADAPGGRSSRNDSELVHAGISVMEAVGDLKRRIRTVDPAQGQEQTDVAHREAALRMVAAFRKIRRLGAEPPRLAEHHIERARELGVDLYGEDD
jgi:transcriptional regulator with XRE-family HTH domain